MPRYIDGFRLKQMAQDIVDGGWDYYYDDDGDLMMRCSECEHWDE